MDTNQSYCQRLAEVLCDLIESGIARPFDVRKEVLRIYPQLGDSNSLNSESLSLLLQKDPREQAKLAVISEYTPSKWLLERELESQGCWKAPEDAYTNAGTKAAIGLCLSGGGIRSATFNLGILQGLAQHRLLSRFNYLSSVSGGGYIHQFLATWVRNRALSPHAVFHEELFQSVEKPPPPSALDDIQDFLHPVPNGPSGPDFPDSPPFASSHYATVISEPLRWLRRYTNYLAPREGLTGLDTWTILAVWLRNTALNFAVLLSAFVFVLLLPHIPMTYWVIAQNHKTSPYLALDIVLFVSALLCLVIPGVAFCKWLRGCGKPADANPVSYRIFLCIFVLFTAALIVSPAAYRSSIPNEFSYCYQPKPVINPDFAPPAASPSHLHYSAYFEDTTSPTASSFKIDADSQSAAPVSRLHEHWKTDRPHFFLSRPVQISFFCLSSLRAWTTHQTPYFFTLVAFVIGNACLLFLLGVAAEKVPILGRIALFVIGLCFAWLLLFSIRILFFIAAFAPPPELISSLGVVILPPLLFVIPFVTLELGIGLIGDCMRDEHREWAARLRAASFLLAATWFLLTGFSLFGPWLFDKIANMAVAKYAVWGSWLATTIGGVLAGHSAQTKGNTDEQDNNAKTSSSLEIVAAVAPPVFIVGLMILVARLTNWIIIRSPSPYIEPARLSIVCISCCVALVFFVLFGFRININDFSMHPFYRDRLARCYAGASNPDRRPNRFTGFSNSDRQLTMASLLPTDWSNLPGMVNAGVEGNYAGPFPVICTSINLTTGEDLAYQERKAASFAFTPLFSGFNVGWTAGKDDEIQFNGFVPTAEYVYTDEGGVSLATAVAISGAAASPNMGYHTSPAIAFLMTVFNVRLGWWLRNTRRRVMYAADTANLPSAPRFGPLRLFDELSGHADDTDAYIYLTDGGHFDNMGLYELIRRRCRTIVVCDSEADGHLTFEGIGMAIRKVRLDFGVEIILDDLDPSGPKPPPAAPATSPSTNFNISAEVSKAENAGITGEISSTQVSPKHPHGLNSFRDYPANATHAIFGTIIYPEDPGKPGHILYIKSSLTGDEPADVLNYRRQHAAFPNDTTLNQFFTESQFESYRRLGQHIIQEDDIVRSWLKIHLPAGEKPPCGNSTPITAPSGN